MTYILKIYMRILTILIFSVVITKTAIAQTPVDEDDSQQSTTPSPQEEATTNKKDVDEITVWGKNQPLKDTDNSSPKSILNPEDLLSINAATTEDLVKYEPSLVIRRRFIGDANGTMGMRGSNMFQTPRSMVFADGVPLHYFLQTRWSGSPRWSLVSADEIAQIEVIYGPYSAEYSGNAMGGAINIETAIPTSRKIHIQGSLFNQNYNELGFNNSSLGGYKGFFSYGDRFGNVSIYTSYNRLENDSQPQNFRLDRTTGTPTGSETNVTGSILGNDEYGNSVPYYSDTGTINAITDHLKFKIGYDMDKWSMLFNIAFENRQSITDSPNNYLTTGAGTPVWNGDVVENGVAFNIRGSNFAVSEQDRKSLLFGGRLKGELSNNWWMEINFSKFEIVEDELRNSLANPLDPAYTLAGEVTDYDDTGWTTSEFKFQNDAFLGNDNLSLASGFRIESYSLKINNYDSDDYRAGLQTTLSNSSGGKTNLNAAFAQLGWQIDQSWDTTFGVRLENWESKDGFYGNVNHINRSDDRTSPKFSIGYNPDSDWRYRYSVAKAYRFPIVEELYQNERRTLGTSLADANLEPEDGFHQNLMLEHKINLGYLRTNIFYENINEVIFAQTSVVDNVAINTFIPIDEVKTRGVEFVYNQFGILQGKLDVRFNVTYTDAEITKNSANPALEGNDFPRMPEWRSGLLMTYHISDDWDFGGGLRYASDNFGDLDNSDQQSNVFGAHDAYTFVNIKSTYRSSDNVKFNFGIDNLTNNKAYVHHPWPARTFFLEAAIDFK